jgi:hypothetical protein
MNYSTVRDIFFILVICFIVFAIGFLLGGKLFSDKSWRTFLVDYSGASTAFATILLVFVTGIYVYFTRRLVSEQTRVRVALSLQREIGSGGHLYVSIVIKNVGFGSAYDISFDIDPADFEYLPNRQISDYQPLRRGIRFLSQGQKLKFQLQEESTIRQRTQALSIKAKYKDSSGKLFEDKSIISYDSIESDYSLTDIAAGLSYISASIDMISMAINSLIHTLEGFGRDYRNRDR